jgi:penicillin-binding protein 1A
MKQASEGVLARMGDRLRRAGRWMRRHPVQSIAAVPLALVVYAAALYPFTPSIGDIRKSKQESPSVVLSADGKELAVFRRANRDWVKLADISPKVTEALLATEDKRFYDHHGIDFTRTARAMVNTLKGDVEGGSTLTQQLARNLYPEQIGREQTINRKIKEAITALKIEAVYSKDEILESYLNSVSFLYNAWGIESAAHTYFDKPAKNLNELEAATLVGMLKGTAYYNPVMNPERALQRRNTVLAMLVKADKLDEARFEQLKAQPLKLDFERLPEFNGMAPHLTEYLRRWLIEWADQHDYNIYADGLVVKTTIDSRLQQMANDAVARQTKMLQAVADVEWSRSAVSSLGSDPSAYVGASGKSAPFEYFWNTHADLVQSWIKDSAEFKAAREQGKSADEALKELSGNGQFMANLRRQKTMLQAGFLAIEPQTGAVKAWVGSRGYEDDKFDHVSQARRQPGSTFKPFVYGAAFEAGHQPNETLLDQPVAIQIDKNQVWRPGDIEGAPSGQPMTLRDALAKSKNTVTAQLMMQVGPSRVASLARAMGVRQSKLNEVPSLALGTSPVTLKEMVASFSTIANGGSYIEPMIVTAVEDREHNVLDSFIGKAAEPALNNQAAMTLLDVLRGTVDYGTAAGLRPRFGLTGDLAGKTGTTQDNTDGWFILMHPQLVAGAWVGFNDNRVTMRSSYWGQGAHNALLLVGDTVQRAQKAGVIAANANFAAPRLRDQEKPLMDRMGDWWNSVFNTPAGGNEPTVAAVPATQLPVVNMNPPMLEPPPRSGSTVEAAPLIQTTPVPADAPVIADQRVPSFPRPLESTRPVDSIAGTRVYRTPDAMARMPDAAMPADVVRAPAQSARAAAYPGTTDRAASTSSMGAGAGSGSRDGGSAWTSPRDGGAYSGSTSSSRDGSSYSGASSSSRDAGSYPSPAAPSRDVTSNAPSPSAPASPTRASRMGASSDTGTTSAPSASSGPESSTAQPAGEATGSPSASE